MCKEELEEQQQLLLRGGEEGAKQPAPIKVGHVAVFSFDFWPLRRRQWMENFCFGGKISQLSHHIPTAIVERRVSFILTSQLLAFDVSCLFILVCCCCFIMSQLLMLVWRFMGLPNVIGHMH
jgi:hypothetical protein